VAHILVHHKIEEYSKWKSAFDDHSSVRVEHGSKGGKIFRNADDPNDIFVLLELSSIEKGKKLAQSDSLKEAMQEAGVISMPEIYFIEEVATTSK
jgi:hypothetical protein